GALGDPRCLGDRIHARLGEAIHREPLDGRGHDRRPRRLGVLLAAALDAHGPRSYIHIPWVSQISIVCLGLPRPSSRTWGQGGNWLTLRPSSAISGRSSTPTWCLGSRSADLRPVSPSSSSNSATSSGCSRAPPPPSSPGPAPSRTSTWSSSFTLLAVAVPWTWAPATGSRCPEASSRSGLSTQTRRRCSASWPVIRAGGPACSVLVRAPARSCQVLPGPAAAHARRALRHDVRAGPGVFVADLDQDPAMLAGPGQGEAARELAARHDEGHMLWLRAYDLRRALIPDDHSAAAARLALVNALEVTRRDGVVLDRPRQPPDRGIEGRPLGHRPRAEHAADLEPQVEVQCGRVMQLHDEPRHRQHAPVCAARVDQAGDLVTLEDQDRSRWDKREVEEGVRILETALRRERPGPYQIQAAIAACHATAAEAAATDWAQIALLYQRP